MNGMPAGLIAIAVRPSPSPGRLQAPPPDAFQIVGALLAIAFALAAAVLGYRIIRGGRGL
ncbi:MAG TPA: hypothetical protein VHV50_05240 [Actinomycetota bacterium]|nr:hypothetical protein [Actinomycetota bacterium]